MRKIYRSIVAIFLIIGLMAGQGVSTSLIKARETPLIPQEDWTEEDWNEYYDEIKTSLVANQSARYVTLDGKTMMDYKMYYVNNDYSRLSGDTLDKEEYVEIPQLTMYPGVFVWDTSMIEEGSEYFPNGYFYVYEKTETDVFKSIASFEEDSILLTAGEAMKLEFFSVSFEQGEIDTFELPEQRVYLAGETHYIDDSFDNDIIYPTSDGIIAGGYAFAHWEDSQGNKVNSVTMTKPLVLHPVYVNEQECTYNDYSIVSNNQYYDWTWDGDQTNNEMPKKTITTGMELLKEIAVSSYNELGKFLIIEGNITINKELVEAFIEETGESVSQYDGVYSLYWAKDFLIVSSEGSLTIDGVNIKNNLKYSSGTQTITTVQSGATFKVINKGSFENCTLSVQEDATVIINNGYIDAESLFNHGTITVNQPNEKRDGQRSIEVDGVFFNSTAGTITVEYGELGIKNEHKWIYNEWEDYTISKIGEMKYVRNKNRGKLNITKEGRFTLNASSSSYQNDRMRLIPFVNEGVLELDAVPTENYYRYIGLICYSRLLNKGTLSIKQNDYTSTEALGWENFMENAPAGLRAYASEVINEGKILINTDKGMGLVVEEEFFDPADTIEATSANTIQYGKLENKENATIEVSSKAGSVGLVIGDDAWLNNCGSLTLTNKNSTQRINNVTLGCYGTIDNSGTITNNGAIGYSYRGTLERLKYTGKPFTGTGFLSFLNYLSYTDGDLLTNSTVLMNVDGIDLGNIASENSVYGFFPAGQTIPITIKATGYEDFSGKFTTSSTVDEYRTNSDYRGFKFALVKKSSDSLNTNDNKDNTNNTKKDIPVLGTKLTDGKKKATYLVTKAGKTVSYVKPQNKKVTSVVIPKIVSINGITYQVTGLSTNAFKNCTKLKKVTVEKYINTIGSNAFYGCKNLKTIKIKTKTLSSGKVGKKAFKGIHAKATITVPSNKVKAYKKLLKARGIGSKVKVKK